MSELIDGGKLRALREARALDQRTLAEYAGIDPSVVSRIERGLQTDLRLSSFIALSRALGASLDALLTVPPEDRAIELDPELAASITGLRRLSIAQQRQVAAILRAYLSTLPRKEDTD